MSRIRRPERRGGRWCQGWLLVTVCLLGLLVLLIRPGSGLGGGGWPGVDVKTPPHLETLGPPNGGQPPLALTGPRSITLVVSLLDGRQRFGQLVQPGAPGLTGGGHGPGAGLTAVVLRPAHLATWGHVAVRAPPGARPDIVLPEATRL